MIAKILSIKKLFEHSINWGVVSIYLPFIFLFFSSQTFSQGNANLISYGGLPQSTSDIKVLYNSTFIIGYSETLKNPIWVIYRLGNMKGTNAPSKWERPWSFAVDPRTEAKVSHEDYIGSGFDRGHMAPNATILSQYGQLAQLETFLMSNICPQNPDMNQGIWADLENEERKISQVDKTNKQVHDLFVITGPIFELDPPDTLNSGVAIPTSFFKIIAYKEGFGGTIKASAVRIPQEVNGSNIEDFLTTVDEIEILTGIEFFSELSNTKQANLESRKRNLKLEEINN